MWTAGIYWLITNLWPAACRTHTNVCDNLVCAKTLMDPHAADGLCSRTLNRKSKPLLCWEDIQQDLAFFPKQSFKSEVPQGQCGSADGEADGGDNWCGVSECNDRSWLGGSGYVPSNTTSS